MVGICGGTGGGKFGGGILGKLGGGIFVGIPGGDIPGTDKPTEPEIEINSCQNKNVIYLVEELREEQLLVAQVILIWAHLEK